MGQPASGLKTGLPVIATHRDDGTIILQSAIDLAPITGTIPGKLAYWAHHKPDAVFLSDQERSISYAQAAGEARRISGALLALAPLIDRPIMILGENSISHAMVMLGATAIGIPTAIVSPAYVGPAAAPWNKLLRVMDQVDPWLVLADDVECAEHALASIERPILIRPLKDLEWLKQQEPASSSAIDMAAARVTPDTVAKLLFTSGSTGFPKAVTNTQRMLVSNMEAIGKVWPFLNQLPPVLVDWLPWNHTFGGNCCFHITLWFGGHMHIDKGRPTAALMDRSIAALRQYRPTVYFNVPIGYELLLPVLEKDGEFAKNFFGSVEFLFSAGAPMIASVRTRLEAIGLDMTGRLPNIVGAWGSTETAPFATVLSFPTAHASNLGVPIPGTAIKLVPEGERYELRVRGPNVMPGYWRDEAATAAAFDEEGFYRMGDAGRLADMSDPAAGILFEGRVAENFKLSSGTFVNVGALRAQIVSGCNGLVSDVVIAGEGHNQLGLLMFLNEAACLELLNEADSAPFDTHPVLLDRIATLLRQHNMKATGASFKIARFLIAAEPPSAAHEEITEKGYINQRRLLSRRSALIEQLFDDGHVL